MMAKIINFIRDVRHKIRAKLLSLTIGFYDLETEAKQLLIHEEKLVSSAEIIYFSEILYLSGALSFLTAIILGSLGFLFQDLILVFGSSAIILSLFTLGLIYSATRIELIFLTTERVVVKHLSIIEKFLRVRREESLTIDQISIISYGRAPWNRGAFISALTGFLFSLLLLFLLIEELSVDPFIQFLVLSEIIIVIIVSISLLLFGLRLSRGILDLHAVGRKKPLRLGLHKGVPRKFIQEVHLAVLERLHHTQHGDLDTQEFPLETSFLLKEAFKVTSDPNEREILLLLDRKPAQAEELCKSIPSMSHEEIDTVLSSLQSKRLIEYLVDEDKWRILDNKKEDD